MLVITVEWSKEALIEAWMADPVAACEKAGVTLPESEFVLRQRQGAGKFVVFLSAWKVQSSNSKTSISPSKKKGC